MTRTASPTLACLLLVLAFLLLFARPASAHHGVGVADPRCAPGYPAEPGVDLSALCAGQVPVGTPGDLDPGASRLMPFIGAGVVTGIALAVVAVIAMRVRKPAPRTSRSTAKTWWVCPACHSMNAADRTACYSCQTAAPSVASRATPTARSSSEPVATATAPATLDQPVGRPAG